VQRQEAEHHEEDDGCNRSALAVSTSGRAWVAPTAAAGFLLPTQQHLRLLLVGLAAALPRHVVLLPLAQPHLLVERGVLVSIGTPHGCVVVRG
jgi:hypothetical protein